MSSPILLRTAPLAHSNQFLGSLAAPAAGALAPYLKYVELTRGRVLAEAGEAIETVYFPTHGIVSLVVDLSSGQTIEVGMVGRTGLLGGSCLVGGPVALRRWIVQVSGAAFTIAADRLRSLAGQHPFLITAAGRHE